MTDFVRRILKPREEDFPVRSLVDNDFYKQTMGQYHFQFHRNDVLTFGLFSRNKNIPLMEVIDQGELARALNHVQSLTYSPTHIAYIRGMAMHGKNMFSEDYINYLKTFKLPAWKRETEGMYPLTFTGNAPDVSPWETLALPVVTELYYRSLMRRMTSVQLHILYSRATNKLYEKLQAIKRHPGITIVEFGHRRRHSFLWQRHAIEMGMDILGPQFLGASNILHSMEHGTEPKGTNAHELPQTEAALANDAEERRASQYKVLSQWESIYGENLRVILPDTFGSEQFFKNAPEFLYNWEAVRGDSGDLLNLGKMTIDWYKKGGVNPLKRTYMPSDGMDVVPIIDLHSKLSEHIKMTYAMGTLFTNDFIGCLSDPTDRVPGLSLTWEEAFKPFSLVCKVISVNGKPAVKLSDTIEKSTGPRWWVEKYMHDFDSRSRISQNVVV
jgi:nicotinate phosphoribosyltransferase